MQDLSAIVLSDDFTFFHPFNLIAFLLQELTLLMADASIRAMKRGEIIAIGSELFIGGRLDTNSLFLSARLGALGIDVRL